MALAQDFHPHSALSGDHLRIVKWMDKTKLLRFTTRPGFGIGLVVGLAMEHHLCPQLADSIHLHSRRCDWHHDHSSTAEMRGAEGHPLGVISCTRSNDT